MTPKQVMKKWIEAFNRADVDSIAELYSEDAINHQVANDPVEGKANIREMFRQEFTAADMICAPINILEDGEWAVMEWLDPLGMRGCGFFQVKDDLIVLQRGYWDKLSFIKLHNLPMS